MTKKNKPTLLIAERTHIYTSDFYDIYIHTYINRKNRKINKGVCKRIT